MPILEKGADAEELEDAEEADHSKITQKHEGSPRTTGAILEQQWEGQGGEGAGGEVR